MIGPVELPSTEQFDIVLVLYGLSTKLANELDTKLSWYEK